MSLEVVRVAVVVLALLGVALAVYKRERTLEIWRKFWTEPTSPVNAAALRIVLFWMLLRSALGQNPLWYARLPAAERDLPYGWRWLGSLPFDEGLVSGAQDALVVSATLALLGAFTRLSAPVAAILSVYVFGFPNFFAKINHAHHARVLCALALAFSPCGDALSLDRLWKRLRGYAAPTPSSAYTAPVRFAWVLIGTTYLFPGLWKLWRAGDLWITGHQLEFEMIKKWSALPQFEPLYRIDRHGWLLALLGIATLVFEIGFTFALVNRVTRTIAALSAVGFHLGIGWFMGIYFHAFFPLVVLLEIPERWKALRRYVPALALCTLDAWHARVSGWAQATLQRIHARTELRPFPARQTWPAIVIGSALVLGQVATGFARQDSWPVSVYPTFSDRGGRPPRQGSSLRVMLESRDEEPVDLGKKLKRMGPARVQKLLRGLDSSVGKGKAKQRGRTVVALFRHAGVHLEPDDRVAIYEATWDVLPPGKRKNYDERLTRRFVVTKDGSLALVR